MPNPKRRHSKTRTAKRRTHDALKPVATSECPQCHELQAAAPGLQELRLLPGPAGPSGRRRIAATLVSNVIVAVDAMGGDLAPGARRSARCRPLAAAIARDARRLDRRPSSPSCSRHGDCGRSPITIVDAPDVVADARVAARGAAAQAAARRSALPPSWSRGVEARAHVQRRPLRRDRAGRARGVRACSTGSIVRRSPSPCRHGPAPRSCSTPAPTSTAAPSISCSSRCMGAAYARVALQVERPARRAALDWRRSRARATISFARRTRAAVGSGRLHRQSRGARVVHRPRRRHRVRRVHRQHRAQGRRGARRGGRAHAARRAGRRARLADRRAADARAFTRFRQRVDYAEYGGAPLLGVAGVALVGHGRSSAQAIESGIAMAARLAEPGSSTRLAADGDRLEQPALKLARVRTEAIAELACNRRVLK